MALIQPKVGFHTGPGGNAKGIKEDYILPVLAAGKTLTIVAADTTAGLLDACVEARKRPDVTGHALCFRTTTLDVPGNNYTMEPEAAAEQHWLAFRPLIPPELVEYKDLVELIITNEVRGQNTDEPVYGGLHIGEWLGRFAVHYRTLTLPEGWRILLFGFAAGTPEVDVWEQPSMLDYLRICGQRPFDTGIALHEYSYELNDILADYPYLIGRYSLLHDVCDNNDIERPRIVISEWGWTYTDVPEYPQALIDIDAVMPKYARQPNVAGAGIWYLGPDFGGIADKAQQLIKPVGQHVAATMYEVEIDKPPDSGDGGNMTPQWKTATRRDISEMNITHVKAACFERIEIEQDGKKYKVENFIGFAEEFEDGRIKLLPGTVTYSFAEFGPEDEPSNPNPPSVVSNPLPQGALFADVSANNKVVDLAVLKANGVQGVGIRLSNGKRKNTDTTDENGVDKMAWYYIEQAETLGMAWLGYHFSNENYNDVEQVRHFLGIVNQVMEAGYIPQMGLWLDFETPEAPVQGSPTTEPRIQAQLTTLANERPSIIADYGPYTSGGWWNGKVPDAAEWVPALGLKSWVSAWPDASVLVNGYPPTWWHPFKLAGFDSVYYWQWTSVGGPLVGHTVKSLDLNYVGDTAGGADKPPTPPPTGAARIGLHASADPGDLYGGETEYNEFKTLQPGVIKVLSAHSETAVKRLASESPGVQWIVRVFQKGWDRNITPQDFFDWTKDDTQRTIDALFGLGVPGSFIWLELHNEPNLVQEGWGASWADGADFNTWLLDVLGKYRAFLPGVKFLYPGLSPGGDVAGARTDSGQFLDLSVEAANACDGVALHAYWSDPFPVSQAYAYIDAYISIFGSKPLWVTEASRNDRPATKTPIQYAVEYFDFWQELKKRPPMQGVTFFVASGSDSYFQPECWVVNQQAVGIAAEIDRLRKL